MLARLFIENIAIIERLNVVFGPGFNAMSGETGAGKSIIIDALGAVLGSRVNREIIRTGEKKASCTAVFENLTDTAVHKIEELGFKTENASVTISRDIFYDGKNNCRIGNAAATVSDLRAVAPYLAVIHGQHDGRDLLDEEKHIDYLDRFAEIGGQLSSFEEKYEELLKLNRAIKASSMSSEEKERRLYFLQYQIAELKELGMEQGEYQALSSKRRELAHFEKVYDALSKAVAFFNGSDDDDGAVSLIGEAKNRLLSCAGISEQYGTFAKRAVDAESACSELSSDISFVLQQMSYDPSELEKIEYSLDKADKLAKKNHVPPEELPELLDRLQAEYSELVNYESDIEELKSRYMEKRKEVSALAQQIHRLREAASVKLCAQIEKQLCDLGMNGAKFVVDIEDYFDRTQARFTKKGTDGVRFLLSANKGEEARPLAKVASGGELSRIMLSIKTVLPVEDEGAATVFDEIDAGVSGRAANSIAEKLYELSLKTQVICITHLPQIAAMADSHYLIEKDSSEGRTYSSITTLDKRGRILEITRLTSGLSVSDAALINAEDMLNQAIIYKQDKEKAE